jgi:hypothetical protein
MRLNDNIIDQIEYIHENIKLFKDNIYSINSLTSLDLLNDSSNNDVDIF